MTQSILDQGVSLMLFGMGTVFVFLTLLVFCTSVMSRVIGRFFKESSVSLAPAPALSQPTGALSPTLRKAIESAIKQHRQRR